jgi:hypothetical protein
MPNIYREDMEEQTNQPTRGNVHTTPYPVNLPNSNTILVLGILSLLLCWWHIFSIAGVILSIVTLSLARKEKSIYSLQPAQFTLSSLNNVKVGRVCAIIGLIISVVVFVLSVLMIIGFFTLMPIWGMVD